MSELNSNSQRQSISEKKFIIQTLTKEGKELKKAHQSSIQQRLKQHTGRTKSAVNAGVETSGIGATLNMVHLKRQRFLDMKTRRGRRKKAYPVHNKVLFGHLNNIIRELKYGFTESVKQKIQQLESNG